MCDAIDQIRPKAHEEVQRHQREKWGQRNRTGKRKNKGVCIENIVFKVPLINIFLITNRPSD